MNTNSRRLSVESLEPRIVLTATASFSDWHNESNGLDVDASGYVTPVDAVRILNAINNFEPGSVTDIQQSWFEKDADAPELIGGFLPDTDGNGILAPIDALRVINRLNRNPTSSESPIDKIAVMPDAQGRPIKVVYSAADGRTLEVDVQGETLNIVWTDNNVMITTPDGIPRVIAKPGVGILEGSRFTRPDGVDDIQAFVTRFSPDGAETVERYICMPIMGGEDWGLPIDPLDPRIPIVGFEEARGAMVARAITNVDQSVVTEEFQEGVFSRLLSVSAVLPTGETAKVEYDSGFGWSSTGVGADLLFLLKKGDYHREVFTPEKLIAAVEELGGTPESSLPQWLPSVTVG